MSKFFKALEQAEQERALRERRPGPAATPPEARPSGPAGPRGDTPVIDRVPAVHRPGRAPAGEIAEPAAGVDEHLVSLLNPTAIEAEQYRTLRYLIEQLRKTAEVSVVAVSSPATGDGKTATAINLAGALAQSPEAKVLLVDADLRQPSMAEQLGLGARGPGLVEAILDPALGLDEVVRVCAPFNLSVIPGGRHSDTPYELLKSPRLEALVQEARARYHHVLLDTPPLIAFPDCRVIGRWVDGFLVVVAAHKTPRRLFEEALNVIEPAKLVGLVFNGDDQPLFGCYDHASGRSENGAQMGWWTQALRKVGLSRRRRSRGRG